MELWIPVTIAAAFLQNLRSALQKRLRGTLSVRGATAARFVYAAPLAALTLAALLAAQGRPPPGGGGAFLGYAAVGGLAQIAATALLIHLFSMRNFAVATTFTKTETVQTALFGLILLGERISAVAAAAIAVSLAGVVLISAPSGLPRLDRGALMGAASGGLFGLSAVSYRAATLSLESGGPLLRAVTAVACVTAFQAVVSLVWLRLRERGEARRLLAAWRAAMWVGAASLLGSLAWFTAFAMQGAALVRALGQIEVVFMIAASVLWFGERVTPRELLGVALVAAGVLGVALAGA